MLSRNTPSGTPGSGRRTIAALALGLALAGTSVGLAPTAASAAENPYERGPAPTRASIEAVRGPFATSQTIVPVTSVTGFGGGTIYYPTDTSQGTFGAIAMSPGYTADQTSLAWLGPRLASQGFVVFIIDTLTRLDQPDSRARQLDAALNYLTDRSSVRSRIDASRLGVMGHSMGGGGTLEESVRRPQLQAAIPLTPWDLNINFSGDRVPTMIVGGQADTIAPVALHSIPFYNSIPASSEKAYLELAGASHFAPNTSNTTIAKYAISWLKRYIDNDTRYDQFLCPAPRDLTISQYRDTCPNS
jgi:predicted dienelactone hydrolase